MHPLILSPILETLTRWDIVLFHLVNSGTQNGLFNVIMPFVTNINNWRIPMGVVWIGLILFGGKKGRIVALMVVVTLTVTDQLSSSILKPLFARTRPCKALEHVHLLVNCSSAFSFPSSHATNIFAQAALFSHFYRKLTPVLFCFAALIGYSRIYVGVHFPFDVLFGTVLGVTCTIVVLVSKNVVVEVIGKIRLGNPRTVEDEQI